MSCLRLGCSPITFTLVYFCGCQELDVSMAMKETVVGSINDEIADLVLGARKFDKVKAKVKERFQVESEPMLAPIVHNIMKSCCCVSSFEAPTIER